MRTHTGRLPRLALPLISASALLVTGAAQASVAGQPHQAASPRRPVAVAANAFQTCVLLADHTVRCWGGDPTVTQWPMVQPGTYTTISSDGDFGCGITPARAFSCWSELPDLVNATPPGGTFTAISAGPDYACAIATDNTLSCWGFNPLDTPGTFSSVSSGDGAVCAVTISQAISCWPYSPDAVSLSPPPSGTFTSVSVGTNWACALRTDGTIDCPGQLRLRGQHAGQAARAGRQPRGDLLPLTRDERHERVELTAQVVPQALAGQDACPASGEHEDAGAGAFQPGGDCLGVGEPGRAPFILKEFETGGQVEQGPVQVSGRADGFLAAFAAGRVDQDDRVGQVGTGPGAVPELGAGQLVQRGAAQGVAAVRRERTVFLEKPAREDDVHGQAGAEPGQGGSGVDAGLAAGEQAAARGAPDVRAQASFAVGGDEIRRPGRRAAR